MDKCQDRRFQAFLCKTEEPLPLQTMSFKELLPPIEGPFGDSEELADPFDRTQMNAAFREDTDDEEQAVPAVRDNGIRKHGMRRFTLRTEEPWYTEAGFHYLTIHDVNQLAVVVGKGAAFTSAAADRAGLRFWPKAPCALIEKKLSGSLLKDKLAIDPILSYHNSALDTMLF